MKGRIHIFVTGFFISTLFACLYIYKPTFLIFLENKTYDTLLRSTQKTHQKQNAVIVDLDEKSLNQLGQWPWPRYRVATLLEKIKELGASGVGLDVIFAEPDQTSPRLLQQSIRKDLGIDFQLKGLPDKFRDNDSLLANTLASGNFTLGYKLISQNHANKQPCLIKAQKIITHGDTNSLSLGDTLFNSKGVVCNITKLASAANSSGFINSLPDIDGILRRSPLLLQHNGEIYPSLAMATLLKTLGHNQLIVKTNSMGVESISINETVIPTDSYGNLLINYYGKQKGFEYISAVDVLNNRVAKKKIDGKIVFIGTSATGLNDLRVTPLDVNFPGVEIHATLVDNIINNEFLARPYSAISFEFISVLGWGLLSTLLLVYSRAGWSLFLLICLSVGMWYGAALSITQLGIILLPTATILTQLVNFSILTFIKYWQEERKVKEQTSALINAQNVSIRGLASLAETRDPETGSHILRTQHYVKALCEHLRSHQKFKGFLVDDTIDQLFKMAPLHDIGKVGVPDRILLKPDRLTPEEFEEMKLHTVYGYQTLQSIEDDLGPNPFLHFAKQIIHAHQEKWDGSGYPQGLKGEEIPIPGRLMALADVYDALISKRVYKEAFSHETAVEIISRGKGAHFDPDITDAFLEIHETFRKIATQFTDQEHEATEAMASSKPNP